ncbi:threonylcarbamoyl-AMP synthase [Patescibacteria group bacterium]|nr:threonylcarbamoyl-AMP synthase [Patescibacteria group bacterium]
MELFDELNTKTAEIIMKGGLGVIPTDTIYGIVASALNKSAVTMIYKIRKRELDKPMIILIGNLNDLEIFNIRVDNKIRKALAGFWPGKTSIIFKCSDPKFSYLHRGKQTLAIRLPAGKKLRSWLKQTGPIVAPSANIAGMAYSKTVSQAQKYFSNKIDFYVDKGLISAKPSKVIEISKQKIIIKRK